MELPTKYYLNYDDEIVIVYVYESMDNQIIAEMDGIKWNLHKVDDNTYTDDSHFITIKTDI